MNRNPGSESRAAFPASVPYSRRVIIAGGAIFGLVLLSVFLWYALYIFLLIFAGILLAILLHAPADALHKYARFSERWSIAIVIGALLLALVLGALFIAPPLGRQIDQLTTAIPASMESLRERLDQYQWGRWIVGNFETMGNLRPDGSEIVNRATGVVVTLTGGVVSLVVVLFVGMYLAVNPKLYVDGVLRLLPIPHRERGSEVLAALGYTLRWWLIGQLIAMAAVGVMTGVGLWLLGVPLWFALGLLAFVLDFVPNFGPLVAAVPGILLAFVDSPQKALYVLMLYFVVQQIEGFLITPLIHQKTVLLPPALTIVAQVLLGVLAGPLGLLLATPMMAATMVLAKMLYVEDALGDEVDTPDDHITDAEKPPVPVPASQKAS